MAFIEDDFIMTIGDDDEVPDLEAVANDSPPLQNKRKLNGKQKGSKKAKAQEPEGDMAKGFLVDLETDGLDAVPQTLDFTLARASLKKRRNPGMYSTLDEKIALSRRAAKLAKLAALDKPDEMEVSEEEKVEEEVSDNDDEVESASDEEEDAEDSAAESTAVAGTPALEGESGSEAESDEEESESEVDSESEESEGESSAEESEVDEIEEARKRAYFAAPEEGPAVDMPESFTTMNLSRQIMKGLTKLGFAQPTPIQARTIPLALLGKDICGGAQTGSGKTAAFLVPILERLLYRPKNTAVTRVLILCPTRELAIQCHNVSTKLAGFTDISTCLCVGGLSLKQQESELKLRPDVVIATPGRLIDHLRNSQSFHLDQIEILVMDEADRMLDDGFEDELTEIIKACPQKRQTMLFSATMTDNVDKLIRLSLQKPVRVQIDPPKSAARGLTQEFVRVRTNKDEDRTALLAALCKRHFKSKCIIFFRSKAAAHQMKIIFGLLGMRSGELHGNLSQEGRLQALEQFRDGHVDFLMATDLAARGLDVTGIDTVINYTMPTQFPQYLHRIGRTARAGRSGRAITLIGETDRKMLKLAVKNSPKDKIKQRVVPNETLNKYRSKVDDLVDQVKDIIAEERQEKMLNDAEMQVTKATNLIQHKDEIKNRPRRTWFQSTKDRKEAKDVADRAYAGKIKSKRSYDKN
ncbi:nucleolar DEAD-box protein required for synthesis of 60S ribosomal subunit [Coemansia sp. IMI 209128]|nr:nucleolar DEAD-box protein required for synthesis of 60S ribosomal subunit [Coemansia sp. IMI 209128]